MSWRESRINKPRQRIGLGLHASIAMHRPLMIANSAPRGDAKVVIAIPPFRRRKEICYVHDRND
jgi:hypothetical protein